jgi:threonine/homoserine/homoserine lactone efflux protein
VTDLAGFLALAILVIVTPGPDTALTIRNTLAGGRSAGVAAASGVALGQVCSSLATLKIAGAAYLVLLGCQSLWSALHSWPRRHTVRAAGADPAASFRQGIVSNLANPKMAVFFPSLLPQFVVPGPPTPFLPLIALGLTFALMTLLWLTAYVFAVARAGDPLKRGRIRRAFEAATGLVLVAFGLRVAASR